jgi:hypothetical protein
MASATKFSESNLPANTLVDLASLSTRARLQQVTIGGLTYTQNATTYAATSYTLPFPGILVAARISAQVVPAGGTLAAIVAAYDESGNAEIILCNSFDPETLTAREGTALTVATTNVALAAGDTITIRGTADNNAVTTQAQGLSVTLTFRVTEETVLDV